MSVMTIEKRTRATVNDTWSTWSTTTDLPPYTSTTTTEYRVQDLIDINFDDFTDGSVVATSDNKFAWAGSGVFDKLMMAVNGNVKAEFDSGRINGSDYAKVYLAGIQSAIQGAIQFLLQRDLNEAQAAVAQEQKTAIIGQEALVAAQTLAATEQKNLYIAQQALVARQAKGFDDDAKYKLLKQSLDSWAVAYSVAQDANGIPDTIKVNVIDSVMKSAMDSLSVTKTNNPLGES